MLTANDVIHGWSPIGGDEDEDVAISQDMRFFSLNPFPPVSESPSVLSPICPPLDTIRPSTYPKSGTRPTSSTPSRVSHTSRGIAPSSDRRAQRNRNRDPTWIPRPRNAFIIFRCEYSRTHSQSSHESQDDDDDVTTTVTVKTLSKRAAEAWKRLPPAERERYKVLADKEREEHTRLYPHYRFRPVKRQPLGTRPLERERSQTKDQKGVSATECLPTTLSAHVPSVLSRSNSSTALAQDGTSPTPPLAALSETLKYPIDAHTEMATWSQEDLERVRALEAYTIGLYNHNLLSSPFPFQAVMLDEPF